MLAIREASTSDRQGAAVVRQRVLPESHPYRYELNIGTTGCLNLVAEYAGTITGFISILLNKDNPTGQLIWERLAPYIGFIGVLPEKQGIGIGKILLRTAVHEVTVRCPKEPALFLEHEPSNHRAHTLFERVGFRTMAEDEVIALCGLKPKGAVMCLHLTASSPSF